jgi:signal transduction histidine kinase
LECSSGFQPSCWRSRDGRLWFSTANGVTTVDPAKTVPNPIAPIVIIEEMLVDNKPINVPPRIGVPLSTARSSPPIQIPPGRHYVQFRYTGLNYSAPDGVRFRVKLEGGKEQWESTEDQRFIGYGPLMPGEYRFHVAASNNDGLWNEAGDTLAFSVMPYFWETWWFRAGLILLALIILGIVTALVQRQRYRRRLERVERQREMEQERSRIARDLHDDLGTSLTQISLLSALANREQTPAHEAKELIQEVRGRAREMVVALDEIVWAVNPQNDSLAGLVSYLGHFAEEFFRATDIRFRLDIPAELPTVSLSAESRHDLYLAFKEALNNIARHSGATEVQLRIAISAQEIIISVTDNGRGFEIPNGKETVSGKLGNGLINMKRRLEQVGGRAEVQSQPTAGTTVTFLVPLQNR